ncbi:MAG: S1C family serine protease [Burkholderiales bacterium]
MRMPWVVLLSTLALFAPPVVAQKPIEQDTKAVPSTPRGEGDTQATLSAIVHIRMKAIEGARSSATLGPQREGTGIVIDDKGHIVTIGYVVTEADSIEITTHDSATVAAKLVGYDHATGLGLLKTLTPMAGVTPLEMGSADALAVKEPVMVLPHGGRSAASLGYVMSKRKFTASWEYLLESALFVSPPTMQWAGAALVNREGKLVGIGSLLLRAVDATQQVPGNMFVPVDELKPILKDLIANGRRAEPARPWLGLGTEELQGHLFVTNVTRGGPAEKAGIRRGDILVGVGRDSVRNHEEFYRRIWSMGAAGAEIPLRLLQGAELKDFKVQSIDRNQHFQSKPAF